MTQAPTALDHCLPTWHFRERHFRRIDAPAELVWRAVHTTRSGDALLAWLLGLVTPGSLDRNALMFGFEGLRTVQQMVMRTDDEFVTAGIGNHPTEPDPPFEDPESYLEMYRQFDRPGYTMTAMNVRYVDGVLSSETRVYCTDEKMRRKFAVYWWIIRPCGGLLRHSVLRAIRRNVHVLQKAEAMNASPLPG